MPGQSKQPAWVCRREVNMSHAGDLGTDDKTCHKVLRASVACGLSHMLSVQLR